MPQDGPIKSAAAVADGLAWAHYFSESSRRCPRMGPFNLPQLLPMVLLGPIISLRAPADAPGWAHLTRRSCCRWFRLGPFLF